MAIQPTRSPPPPQPLEFFQPEVSPYLTYNLVASTVLFWYQYHGATLYSGSKFEDSVSYKLAIQLFKMYNWTETNNDWLDMNVQQNFNSRSKMFQINDYSNIRVGKNMIANESPKQFSESGQA